MARLTLAFVLITGLFFVNALAEDLPLKEVFPEAVSFIPVIKGNEIVYYEARDKKGKLAGACFTATGKSYSEIKTLVGMFNDGTITAIKVLSQNETPGLGSKVAESEFTDRFRNIKDVSKVQAITGASVSSSAVIEAVKKRAEEIKSLMTNDKIQNSK
ncbi:MAG: FMN-binding protein [Candidatus Omnitrophota bacterium]|jgi:electron transport complex protein RnfG